jgi:hypothetical protein
MYVCTVLIAASLICSVGNSLNTTDPMSAVCVAFDCAHWCRFVIFSNQRHPEGVVSVRFREPEPAEACIAVRSSSTLAHCDLSSVNV